MEVPGMDHLPLREPELIAATIAGTLARVRW